MMCKIFVLNQKREISNDAEKPLLEFKFYQKNKNMNFLKDILQPFWHIQTKGS